MFITKLYGMHVHLGYSAFAAYWTKCAIPQIYETTYNVGL